MQARLLSHKTLFRYFLAVLTGTVLSISSTSGQVNTYTFTPVGGTFTPLTGATPVPVLQEDDALSPAIPIGFPFTYDATVFTQLQASSNGFITFNTANLEAGQSNNLTTASPCVRCLLPSGTI
ncbi:hypothetical protein [Hymenobacter volaticus]|uniref:Uncharacterized protein n=1 Tax=Hymenobacter volaticus TaxID=2932254 RepID=A0ABY4G8C6_9BACT|nr:hypothetical protein [Hymenobacter volaticus]UOQ67152.1 hypothetical protein MUN86_04410 [Hymenobacter volaticus]